MYQVHGIGSERNLEQHTGLVRLPPGLRVQGPGGVAQRKIELRAVIRFVS